MIFAERLRAARIEKGLQQTPLSEKININLSTYNNYERGIREPDLESLAKIADALEVSVDFLLGRSDQRKIDPGYNDKMKYLIDIALKLNEGNLNYIIEGAERLAGEEPKEKTIAKQTG